jgi:hypothetical protein
MGRGYYGLQQDDDKELLICQVVMHWPLQMPANLSHTIVDRRHIGRVLGEGWASLVCCIFPHSLLGGTSADDSGRFVIITVVFQ